MAVEIEDLTYHYCDESAAPVREQRIGACNAYGGTCSGAKSGCTLNSDRRFCQVQGCQLVLSVFMLLTVPNLVVITHAPLGCGAQTPSASGYMGESKKSRGSYGNEVVWISTNLGEEDIIFGGEEKLKETILYADKVYKPDAIAVACGCVPALVGDDVDSVVSEAAKVTSAKVFPVHCEGFRSKLVSSAYDSTYHGMIKLTGSSSDAQPIDRLKFAKTVNIITAGSFGYGDDVELARLVKKLGLEVNILPLFARVKDIERFSEAALNVSACATHDDYLLGHLKEKFGTPYLIDAIPVGLTYTASWLRKIAAFFHLEEKAEQIIEEETAKLKNAIAPFVEQIKGKKVYLAGGEIRVLALAQFLDEIGMKVVGIKAHHYDLFAQPLLEPLGDVQFHAAPGMPFEQANLINRVKPDLFIGHAGYNAFVLKQGIPCMPLWGASFNYLGYAGAYETVRKAAKILENTSFTQKISKNLKLPYRKDWFEKDPFSEIRNETD